MIELPDTANNNHLSNKAEKGQNIDIINYQTVSFDPKSHKTKRSLSLNIYKYEQMLGPKEDQSSSLESIASHMEHQQKYPHSNDSSFTTTKMFNSFGLVISLCSMIMMAILVYLVIENRSQGKTTLLSKNQSVIYRNFYSFSTLLYLAINPILLYKYNQAKKTC